MNENMTRDQLAISATEEDLKWFYMTPGRMDLPIKSREEARYAFADAMIKASGDAAEENRRIKALIEMIRSVARSIGPTCQSNAECAYQRTMNP